MLCLSATTGSHLENLGCKSYATPESGQAYARAWELCQRIGDTPQVLPGLFGLWLFYVVKRDYPTSRDMAVWCLTMAQDADDTGGIVLDHVLIVRHRAVSWQGARSS